MKRCIVCVLLMTCFTAVAVPHSRKTTRSSSRIQGVDYVVRLDDGSFTNVPEFQIDSDGEPPVSITQALRLAQGEFSRLREPQVDYTLDSVWLERFHETAHWFYMVHYKASGTKWKSVEPYRTKIKEDKNAALRAPRITIIILLDGSVVEHTLRN